MDKNIHKETKINHTTHQSNQPLHESSKYIRWVPGVKPHYKVNKTVEKLIEECWYNVPILSKSDPSLFLSNYTTIHYRGDTPYDLVDDAMKNIDDLMLWFFLGCCGLITLFLVGYWLIKNNLKQK